MDKIIIDPENCLYVPAKYFHVGRLNGQQPEIILIHTVESPDRDNTAENVAHYFQNPDYPASCHYTIDNNSIVQCVYDHNTAFGCKNANHNGLHLELAGFAAQSADDWANPYNSALIDNAAQTAAYLCKKFGLPVQYAEFASSQDPTVIQKGICGHKDVPLHGSHTDPGLYFPFGKLFELTKTYLN